MTAAGQIARLRASVQRLRRATGREAPDVGTLRHMCARLTWATARLRRHNDAIELRAAAAGEVAS